MKTISSSGYSIPNLEVWPQIIKRDCVKEFLCCKVSLKQYNNNHFLSFAVLQLTFAVPLVCFPKNWKPSKKS